MKMKHSNQKLAGLLVCFFCIVFATTSLAQEKPSGTVTITSKSVAIGIGVSWGHGVLKYNLKTAIKII